MKNIKKRLLSALLSLAMVLTLVPALGTTAFAADITTCNAIIDEPVAGGKLDFSAESADPEKYHTHVQHWIEIGDGNERIISSSEANTYVCKAGKKYVVVILFIQLFDYHTFSNNTAFYINGRSTFEQGAYNRGYLFPKLTALLESISVTTPPTKRLYKPGANFDTAGMVVTGRYNDGNRAITNYTVTNGKNLTAGQTSVTISYTAHFIPSLRPSIHGKRTALENNPRRLRTESITGPDSQEWPTATAKRLCS